MFLTNVNIINCIQTKMKFLMCMCHRLIKDDESEDDSTHDQLFLGVKKTENKVKVDLNLNVSEKREDGSEHYQHS